MDEQLHHNSTNGTAVPSVEAPLPSTNGSTATARSMPLSPRVSEVATEKSTESPSSKKVASEKSTESPSAKKLAMVSSGKKLAKFSSGEKMFEFMLRLDPSGLLLLLCLVSMVYVLIVSWRVWSLFDQPADLFWSMSLLVCFLYFVWTMSVSDRRWMVISQFAYMLLLSCAGTHFLGPLNGMLVMYMSTLYAAGLLGYTTFGYCQRLRIALVTFKANGPSHDEVGASLLCCLISVSSVVCSARIAWLILVPAPDTSHRTFFKSFDYVIEMCVEICGTFGMWILYITQFDLRGAILSVDTFAWAAPSFLCGGILVGVFLFLVIGDTVAIIFLWIGTMALMGFFGYILALRACYKTIVASCHLSTKWAQRSDKVYLTIELADAKDVMLDLKPDGHFNFSAKGHDEIQYELHVELFGAIDIEQSKVAVSARNICYLIKKAGNNWWPRLFKKEGEPPVLLKVDLDKWQDEDHEDAGADDVGDMVFLKLLDK